MNDFPTYPQEQYHKPHALFLFCGSPLGLTLILCVLVILCMLSSALFAHLWVIALLPFILILLLLLLGQIGLFMQRKIITGLLSILLTLTILINASTLVSWYEDTRLRLLEPQMRTIAEEIITTPEYFAESNHISINLPWYRFYLSRGAPIHVIRDIDSDRSTHITVRFMLIPAIPDGGRYCVYQSNANPDWESDPDFLTEHLYTYYSE